MTVILEVTVISQNHPPSLKEEHLEAPVSEQILWRLRSGDETAFAQVYQQYKARVYGYCYRLLRNEQDAEDATQEAFLKVMKSIATLEKAESFRPWMFTIARNEAYAILRRTKNINGIESDEIWAEETPYEELIGKETAELVQRYLNLLKPVYREVLILREYEQLSYAEIARVTGDTESSVKSRIFKARKALTEKLKPYF
ncbi:MAG: sigma-70 family RNA polymerase sigma factor [Ignavibacteriales bacterium]|nr:sigma-70 family RNA polymerase sigma factor [Ignavibacteriales bacterium]